MAYPRSQRGPIAVGALIALHAAEARDDRVDEPRVDGLQIGEAEAHARERARAQVVDQHVAFGHQPPEHFLAGVGAKVQRDALLVAVVSHETRRLALSITLGKRRHGAARIAAAGALDLDDLGAGVGQEQGAIGAGHVLVGTDDTNSTQWTLH